MSLSKLFGLSALRSIGSCANLYARFSLGLSDFLREKLVERLREEEQQEKKGH